jgi:hypothetical protein
MKRASLLGIALLSLLAASACRGTASYNVVALHHETVREKLDAQWFQRDVYDKRGKLTAVELVYCPMRPGQSTVCRTAVVWRRNDSALMSQ